MADTIAIARDNVDAFSAGDWGRFKSTLTPDSVYHEVGTQRRVSGPDKITELSQGWRAAFPDARGTVTNAIATGDQVVLEITWEGTQRGEMQGPTGAIPASGKRVTVEAVQVFRFAGDKIKEVRHYFDLLGLLQQIGAVPAAAGR